MSIWCLTKEDRIYIGGESFMSALLPTVVVTHFVRLRTNSFVYAGHTMILYVKNRTVFVQKWGIVFV